MSVWHDGKVVANDAVPLADDRGLLLGDGLFETILVVGGSARHLAEHLARLARSGAALGIAVPEDLATTLDSALPSLLLAERRPSRAALRITITRGRGRGLAPTSRASSPLFLLERLPEVPSGPAAALIVDAPRSDPRDPLAGHKTLSRMARVEARRSALAGGADVALLTTIEGDVCDADAANLFAVVDGVLVTPPLDRGVLRGLTRARCIAASARDGRRVVERPLSRSDIARASEAFLSSSLDGLRPLRRIDDRPLAAPGEVVARLASCGESA